MKSIGSVHLFVSSNSFLNKLMFFLGGSATSPLHQSNLLYWRRELFFCLDIESSDSCYVFKLVDFLMGFTIHHIHSICLPGGSDWWNTDFGGKKGGWCWVHRRENWCWVIINLIYIYIFFFSVNIVFRIYRSGPSQAVGIEWQHHRVPSKERGPWYRVCPDPVCAVWIRGGAWHQWYI